MPPLTRALSASSNEGTEALVSGVRRHNELSGKCGKDSGPAFPLEINGAGQRGFRFPDISIISRSNILLSHLN